MITTMKNNTMMFAALIVFSMLIFVNAAQAGGDKVRKENPVFDQEGNVVGLVVPMNCEELTNMTSGESGWFCTDPEAEDDS